MDETTEDIRQLQAALAVFRLEIQTVLSELLSCDTSNSLDCGLKKRAPHREIDEFPARSKNQLSMNLHQFSMQHYQSIRTVSSGSSEPNAGARDSQEGLMNFLRDLKINSAKLSTNIQCSTTRVSEPSAPSCTSQVRERETHRKS